MIGQLTAISISGHQVARFLDLISEERQLPRIITCDNGTALFQQFPRRLML
jgi:putative transposase